MQEDQIIERCKKEEEAAFKMLYESFLPYVLTIIRRFGILDKSIPDMVQDIFIEVFKSIKKYDSQRGEFKYWLKSIVIHKILNFQRIEKKHKKVELTMLNEVPAVELTNLESIDKEFLLRLISELPEGYRTVFNLYIIDGFSHKEISHQLGIDPVSSRSQLSRAKQLLKKRISTIQKENLYGLI